jgi:hypothetical protein
VTFTQVPEKTHRVVWHAPEEGLENGKPLDVILSSHTPEPSNQPIQCIYFLLENELYQFNLKTKQLEKPHHSNWITIQCHQILVKNDVRIFKRLLLQIKLTEPNGTGKLYDIIYKLAKNEAEHQLRETGSVLAQVC